MHLLQILECSDYELVIILDVIRKIFLIIQIVVPILLIIFSTTQLITLMTDPEKKDGVKTIINKFIAAVIVFFLPVMVNSVMNLVSDSFDVAACWKMAETKKSDLESNSGYVDPYADGKEQLNRYKLFVNPDDIEKPPPVEHGSGGSGGSNPNNTAKGIEVVTYAKQFVGKPYVWGGSWNGELPYHGTDCSGFVGGVYRHFGYSLPRTTAAMWANRSSMKQVDQSDIQAGDIVLYPGHVAMLTGNGTEIVHAKGRRYGIVIDKDYRKASSKGVRGIFRILK